MHALCVCNFSIVGINGAIGCLTSLVSFPEKPSSFLCSLLEFSITEAIIDILVESPILWMILMP